MKSMAAMAAAAVVSNANLIGTVARRSLSLFLAPDLLALI